MKYTENILIAASKVNEIVIYIRPIIACTVESKLYLQILHVPRS